MFGKSYREQHIKPELALQNGKAKAQLHWKRGGGKIYSFNMGT